MKKKMLSIVGAAAMGSAMFMTGCKCPMSKCHSVEKKCTRIKYDNSYYYNADGSFNMEKAKDAVINLMKYHGYPVYPGTRDNLWITDYGQGNFAEVGLAARVWANNVKDKYMLIDIYLMPNQMLPEHWHAEGEGDDAKYPVKMEGWLVRHGLSHIVGEGEPNLTVKIPKIHCGGTATVQHEVIAKPGDFVGLNRPLAHHWQMAGPEGAIITESANCHINNCVRHQDKALNDAFLGK